MSEQHRGAHVQGGSALRLDYVLRDDSYAERDKACLVLHSGWFALCSGTSRLVSRFATAL